METKFFYQAEPNSRFDVKTKGLSSSVGKICIEGAAGQALRSFSGGNTQEGNTEETGKLDDLPLVAVVTNGRIMVEVLVGLEQSHEDMEWTVNRDTLEDKLQQEGKQMQSRSNNAMY